MARYEQARIQHGREQAERRAQGRERLSGVNVSGLRLLLIDDVLLTGQSLERLCVLLTEAGASVSCVVLARALRGREVSWLAEVQRDATSCNG